MPIPTTSMRTQRLTRFRGKVAAVILLAMGCAAAGTVKVVVNPAVKANEISMREVKRIFRQETQSFSGNATIEPIIQRRGSTHNAFLRDFLGEDDEALQKYYQLLVFTGHGSMPKVFYSDAEVVAYVARNPGAIGYVDAAAPTHGVKILFVVDGPAHVERRLIDRVEPVYPEELQKRGIGGVVRLRITITTKGEVKSVGLLGGSAILAESAMVAVRKWRYAASFSETTIEVSIPFHSRP